jgi:hypothetical protein
MEILGRDDTALFDPDNARRVMDQDVTSHRQDRN